MEMPFELGFEYILNAINQSDEEKIYEMWLHKAFDISYQEFRNKFDIPVNTQSDVKSVDEILSRVKNILNGGGIDGT